MSHNFLIENIDLYHAFTAFSFIIKKKKRWVIFYRFLLRRHICRAYGKEHEHQLVDLGHVKCSVEKQFQCDHI